MHEASRRALRSPPIIGQPTGDSLLLPLIYKPRRLRARICARPLRHVCARILARLFVEFAPARSVGERIEDSLATVAPPNDSNDLSNRLDNDGWFLEVNVVPGMGCRHN